MLFPSFSPTAVRFRESLRGGLGQRFRTNPFPETTKNLVPHTQVLIQRFPKPGFQNLVLKTGNSPNPVPRSATCAEPD